MRNRSVCDIARWIANFVWRMILTVVVVGGIIWIGYLTLATLEQLGLTW